MINVYFRLKIKEPSLNLKYYLEIDSEQVLWRKDEKNLWKGLKRFWNSILKKLLEHRYRM